MFQYIAPQFVPKSVLKKKMLDELRDYPRIISEMLLGDCGNGVIKGTRISWENELMTIGPGLLVHNGHIYRMEEEYKLTCTFVDRLTFLKVRFASTNREKGLADSAGEIYFDENPPEAEEIELGRFRLQEGARLRTEYENAEDYQTEFDTLNRIHMPYFCPGGMSLWPKLLLAYAKELLETKTTEGVDVSFCMQVLGSNGQVSKELLCWYIENAAGKKLEKQDNEAIYGRLMKILRGRKNGQRELKGTEPRTRQMLLL